MQKLKTEKRLEQAIIYRMSLLKRRRTAGELKTELATLIDIAELEALYPEKNVNIKGELTLLKKFNPTKLTTEQLER